MTVVDAVRAGLIDEDEDRYTDTVTGRTMTIQQAVEKGYVCLGDGTAPLTDLTAYPEDRPFQSATSGAFNPPPTTKFDQSHVPEKMDWMPQTKESKVAEETPPKLFKKGEDDVDGVRKAGGGDGLLRRDAAEASREEEKFIDPRALVVPTHGGGRGVGREDNTQSEDVEEYIKELKDGSQEKVRKYQYSGVSMGRVDRDGGSRTTSAVQKSARR